MKISKIIAAALSLSFLVSTAATTNSNTQNTSITANAEGHSFRYFTLRHIITTFSYSKYNPRSDQNTACI